MKRLLCVALVLCLALPLGGVFAAGQVEQERVPVEHLLWDIPFGIGVEECLALVKERMGVEMSYSHDDERSVTYIADPELGMTFYGYPTQLWAIFFVPENELRFFELWVFGDEKWSFYMREGEDEALFTGSLARALREVTGINGELEKLHGAPTGGSMLIRGGEEGVSRDYFLPMRGGVLDDDLVEKIFTRFGQNEASGALSIYYDNIEVSIHAYTTREWEDEIGGHVFMYLRYSARDNFNKDEARSFEAEDGEYQLQQLEKEKR